MKSNNSPIKAIQYASKINLIDSHVNKGAFLQTLVNQQYQQIIKAMAFRLVSQPPQQIVPFVAKNIVFETNQSRYFIIKEQIVPKGKRFMLNVNAYGHIKLQVKVNDRPPKLYSFQGKKVIQIYQSSFSEVRITASMQKKGIFCEAKFYLDLIQLQFTSKVRASAHLKPNIDKELEEYLSTMRGKTAQILRNRSLTRNKQMLSRKTLSTFRTSTKNFELVRSKSQFQSFQRKKSLYIQHVRKMSPSKTRMLQEQKQKYYTSKNQQMFKLSVLVYITKLALKITEARVREAAAKVKKMKVSMLCVEFVKIIKNKFRLKITEKARLRMCLHHTMQFIPLVQRKNTITQAKQLLLQALTPFMNYRTVQEVSENCFQYIESARKIQKYIKAKMTNLRQRATILVQKIIQKQKIDCTQSQKKKIIQKYIKICNKKGGSITKLYLNRQDLIALLRKNSLP